MDNLVKALGLCSCTALAGWSGQAQNTEFFFAKILLTKAALITLLNLQIIQWSLSKRSAWEQNSMLPCSEFDPDNSTDPNQ